MARNNTRTDDETLKTIHELENNNKVYFTLDRKVDVK